MRKHPQHTSNKNPAISNPSPAFPNSIKDKYLSCQKSVFARENNPFPAPVPDPLADPVTF
jgi:hypothetical protein